ncbi:MAG: prepilin-type N-terminal cleavage/methylation domain-containing protein [Nitrospinota bacterium]
MQSKLIQSQENPKSNLLRSETGFSLLEVVVALAILAGGFLAVLNLFSGSVRSVDFSGQYLKAVTLANSKMNELAIQNFAVDDSSGNFKNEENYRWELNISPYDSELNDEDSSIQLQKVLLKVLWNDNGNARNIELATLRLEGQTHPVVDTKLEQLFKGGAGSISSDGQDDTSQSDASTSTQAPTSTNICGSSTVNISGSGTAHVSGN